MTAMSSACVDCGAPLIGERLRCPACHDQHAADLSDQIDEHDATVPRPRRVTAGLMPSFFVTWLVIAELIAIVALLSIFAFKGCS